jgi:uncharacterized protein
MRPALRSGAATLFVDGAAGRIETVLDLPDEGRALRGIALVAHPHPLFGGTLDNKVVQTLAKTFAELGYAAVRSMLMLASWARTRFDSTLPIVAAGFSFGAWIQTRVAERIAVERLVLVAPPAGFVTDGRHYTTGKVAANTIVIHGEQDETVPLANIFEWARPQDIAITVIPGADHFFHRKLTLIRSIIQGQWR